MNLFLRIAAPVILLFSALSLPKSIEPGESIELSENEGIAVFTINIDATIKEISLDRVGSIFSFPRIADLEPGKYVRVLTLPAGDYKFDRFKTDQLYWEFDDVLNSRFTIKPGTINYVGEVRSRGNWFYRTLSVENNALGALIDINRQYPGISNQFPWTYAGASADPLIDSFSTAAAFSDNMKSVGSTVKIEDRDAAEIYFRPFSTAALAMSPTGQYALIAIDEGQNIALQLVDLFNTKQITVYTGPRIRQANWARDDVLTLIIGNNSAISKILRVRSIDDVTEIPIIGANLFGTNPNDGNVIVSTSYKGRVRLVEIEPAKKIDKSAIKKGKVVGNGVRNVVDWWLDKNGAPRLAQRRNRSNNDIFLYTYVDPRNAENVDFELKLDKNERFNIAGLDSEGNILVLTNRDRNFIELVHFDPRNGALGDTVVGVDGSDLTGVYFGSNHAVASVSYEDRGQLRVKNIDDQTGDVLYEKIAKALPGKNVRVDGATQNGSRLVYADGPIDPGTIYLYQPDGNKLDTLTTVAPHLEGRQLAGTESFSIDVDGVPIESFLTASDITKKNKPLLVLIHGGPFEIADNTRFNSEVQFFARIGFAVLQVNFRGSAGYGKAHAALGNKNWGTTMVADVDAAVEHVITNFDIDKDRIVAVGTSYGAYSAVTLASSRPSRYKAAVGICGVYDLPLVYSSGVYSNNKRAVTRFKEVLGDPKSELDLLISQSPAYTLSGQASPILLVHDRGDRIAPIEHAYRLVWASQKGKDSVALITTNDETHGLVYSKSAIAQYPKIARFLREALNMP